MAKLRDYDRDTGDYQQTILLFQDASLPPLITYGIVNLDSTNLPSIAKKNPLSFLTEYSDDIAMATVYALQTDQTPGALEFYGMLLLAGAKVGHTHRSSACIELTSLSLEGKLRRR